MSLLRRGRARQHDATVRRGRVIDAGSRTGRRYEVMSPKRFLDVLRTFESSPSVAEGIKEFRKNDRKMLAVYGLVAAGAEVPEGSIYHLLPHDPTSSVGYDFWLDEKWFDDDAGFSATRLSLIALLGLYATEYDGRGDALPANAAEQVERMAAAGRLDQSRLSNLSTLVENRHNLAFTALLAAHMTEADAGWLNDGGAYQYNPDMLPVDNQFFERVKAATAEVSTRMFVEYWLPAQISAEEYAAACDLAPAVLKELYADVWAAGYAGYRMHVQGRTIAGAR